MDLNLNSLTIRMEDSQLEAKAAQHGLPNSIWATYSAFANTNGGQILLGVSEERGNKLTITGVDNPEKAKKDFWDTINNPTKVSHNLLSNSDFNEIVLEDGKSIFIIHVPAARLELRPIYINNDLYHGTYKRNHEGDYHCTKDEIASMLRDAYPHSYDSNVLDNFRLSDLTAESIKTYRRYHEAFKPDHPWLKLDDAEYLVMLGAARVSDKDGEIHPTLAGLLMFSEEYKITAVCSEFFLDYRENLDPEHVRWTDRMQSSSGEWSGNLFDFFLSASRKIVQDFKVPFKLKDMVRVENTALHDAAREALVNCLANADYFGRGGIVIKKNIDSIVYENPGSIRVGKNQMIQGGISDPRNKNIMKMFNLIGYGEKAGSGFPGIIDVCRANGIQSPSIEENIEFNRTIVSLWLKEDLSTEIGDKKSAIKTGDKKSAIKTGDKFSKEEQRMDEIYNYLLESGESSTKKISEEVGLGISRTRELLGKMVSNGVLGTTGENKNRRYHANE